MKWFWVLLQFVVALLLPSVIGQNTKVVYIGEVPIIVAATGTTAHEPTTPTDNFVTETDLLDTTTTTRRIITTTFTTSAPTTVSLLQRFSFSDAQQSPTYFGHNAHPNFPAEKLAIFL